MPKTPKLDRSLLAAVPLFCGLDSASCDHVIAAARMRRVARNAAAFEQGDPADAFFVLVEGRLKVVQTTPSGQQMIVHLVNPGEFFGCVALMGGKRYPGSAVAVEESTVLSWTLADAHHLIQRHPVIASNALAGFGDRLLKMNARLREIHTETADQRLAHALLHLIGHSGRRTRSGIAIEFPITRQEVAELAGTTLHTASRTISKWGREGIVRNARRKIVVTNVAGLMAIAEEPEQ